MDLTTPTGAMPVLLTPRYDTDPVIVLDGRPDAIGEPAMRQRRRLLDTVCGFTVDELARPSRCAGWSNRDVIAHLAITNEFWSFAIRAGRRGEPSRVLTSFDPVSTPADMVESTRKSGVAEVVDRFAASTTDLTELLASLEGEAWTKRAEAPPGHLTTSGVVHHALWDSWVHERDMLVPLGASLTEEADEIAAALRYAAALGPAFAATGGSTDTGRFAVTVNNPEVCFEVDIADQIQVRSTQPDALESDRRQPDLALEGEAVGLLEAFSIRTDFPPVPRNVTWMTTSLARTFS